jgi:hypothetical protein
MVFDVKYDLIHNERLGAGGDWTVNDNEDIYSGVVRMDTLRIGFFLGELYGLSCCVCDIGNAFFNGKTKEKVYITAGSEFGANVHGKNLIIDKSLYGSKTSAARFHEHLSGSLLRLWCKKTKHDLTYGWWTSHQIMNIWLCMWMTFLFGARILWQS